MAQVDALLLELEHFGATVTIHDGGLRVEAADDLPDGLYQSLREHSAAVVARLRGESPANGQTAAATTKAAILQRDPWPAELPVLGRRTIAPFSPCSDCGNEWTWVVYGSVYLCRSCAQDAGLVGDGGTPSRRRSPAVHTDW